MFWHNAGNFIGYTNFDVWEKITNLPRFTEASLERIFGQVLFAQWNEQKPNKRSALNSVFQKAQTPRAILYNWQSENDPAVSLCAQLV